MLSKGKPTKKATVGNSLSVGSILWSRAWMLMVTVRTQACCTKRSKSKSKAVRLNMEIGLQWDLLMRRLAEELVVLIMLLSIHSTMTPFTPELLQVDCG